MKKIVISIVYTILFISCEKEIKHEENIQIRYFCLASDLYNNIVAQKITIEKKNQKRFIYKYNNINDTLLIENDAFYFRNELLIQIDKKDLPFNNKNITIYKCHYKEKRYGRDLYLYIDMENGLLFKDSHAFCNMTEYEVNKFHELQKKIALKQLGFKDGPFEVILPYRNYPEIKE